ncbi:Rv3212 family protein [Saccharopolyspora taberi]|uniref:PQQ-binding-like beta-propeller repeat protein n=1 Tax=Saccharopolyspora taberi TaxID=60895 RepID=A0ABN3VJJ1_9PSEU
MVRPERRRKADVAAVVLIALAVVVASVVVWAGSDARATISEPAAHPAPDVPPTTSVPAALHEMWRARSPATPVPVVAGPAVVTGAGNEVLGRDPVTGQVRWRYARDIPLCTIGTAWDRALAVFRKEHNCSEITSLRGDSGLRGPQRNADAEFGTRLLSDGTYVTATGREAVESWRSDLVRTQQFGIPPALKNPGNNLKRPGCEYLSVAASDERVGLVEQCPREQGERITLIKTRPEDDEKPEEIFSTGLGSTGATVVAVSKKRAAVLTADRSELVVFDNSAAVVGTFPVRAAAPAGDANARVAATSKDGLVHWHTGVDTVALDPANLTPVWTAPDTLGPGTIFGERMIVPVPEGLAVLDPKTGARERVIPVDRQGYSGPVQLDSVGDVLVEQRGTELVALR